MSAARLAEVAQRVLPPFLLDLLRKVRKPPFGFFGSYSTYEAAAAAAGQGYEDPELVAKLVENQRSALSDPSSTVASERHQRLSFALARAIQGPSLSVLDFGGGLGEHRLDARGLFPELDLEWDVVETAAMADAGSREFAEDGLRFQPGLDGVAGRSFDLIYVSGSLQYVPDAHEVWDALADIPHGWVCIDRLPLVGGPADVYAVQHARRPDGVQTRYAVRLLSEQAWRSRLSRTHEIVWEWRLSELPYADSVKDLSFAGLLLRPRV